MDDDRKYRQRGYQDSNRPSNGHVREERPRQPGPRPPLDVTGPRLPRLVQSVTAARCFNCATMLPSDIDFSGKCPKCAASLHCCKQCAHFEPSTRFQCLKPIPARIAVKDQANECDLFKPRITVARDATSGSGATQAPPSSSVQPSTNPGAARAAFDNLFKKS